MSIKDQISNLKIEKVSWTSNNAEYKAIKLEGSSTDMLSCVETKINSLLEKSQLPTAIIGSRAWIAKIKNLFANRLIHDRLNLDLPGSGTLALQADHRIDGVLYILYEEMAPGIMEAPEFEGLETLP